MHAVVETGGKQYRVVVGDTVDVEKLPAEVGETVMLDRVLLVGGGEAIRVGQPMIEGAQVRAKVVAQAKQRKVVIFKYRQKNRYRCKTGHRQQFTRLQIEEIIA